MIYTEVVSIEMFAPLESGSNKTQIKDNSKILEKTDHGAILVYVTLRKAFHFI